MRPWVWRGPALVLVAALAIVGTPVLAEAAPISNLLPGGASLGEVLGVDGHTGPVGSDGPCGYTHASIYRVTASADSVLTLAVADDVAGSLSLCSVGVYDSDGSSDAPSSAPLAATGACASAESCELTRSLKDGATYDVVFWSAPPEPGNGPDDAVFVFDVSVKRPAHLSTTVDGERLTDLCTGVHEVRTGMRFAIRSTTTSVSTGTIVMRLERRVSGAWQPYATYSRPLSSGVASLALTAGSSGLYRITTTLPGTDTRVEAERTLQIAYVTPKWKRYADGGVRLLVPWYRQQMRLSCEAATLRMAHNYFRPGRIDSDWDVLKVTGVDDRRKRGNRWGNPNETFVGKPNGRMMRTGYGVHWAPIARAATTFNSCRPAIVLRRPSRATIARYVAMGFPVIVWGAHAGPSGVVKKVWKAWDGEWITAWSVEHVWVVVGFHGKADKPTSFIVHNPSGGARRKVSLRQFDAFTKYFRRAVVVRG